MRSRNDAWQSLPSYPTTMKRCIRPSPGALTSCVRTPVNADRTSASRAQCVRWGLVFALVASVACERPTAVTLSPPIQPAAATFARLTAPVTDPAMGKLSPVARQVIAALRDPDLRRELALAMKDTSASYSLDLQDCRTVSLAARLLASGERNGFGTAASACARLTALNGAILYMAPERLEGWDGTVIPLVTAIEHPESPLPTTVWAYRSPSRAVELSSSHPGSGPLLVILPSLHPRQAVRRPMKTTPHMIPVHQDTTGQVKR